jgi:DNA (cytosine-5)-methyltransferase 1
VRNPLIIDLFCCAGGASVGYYRAGFEPTGVDIVARKRYPFPFIEADATMLTKRFLRQFDAVHASPPCQGYTAMRHAPGAKGAPLLIDVMQDKLEDAGIPYILENVEEAAWAMPGAIMLCGSHFGLGAQGCQLQRHRLFISNKPIQAPGPCKHDDRPVIGVYGGHARVRSAKHGGRGTKDVWEGGHKTAMSQALGIEWMTTTEMSEALPPNYTEYLGRQLMEYV